MLHCRNCNVLFSFTAIRTGGITVLHVRKHVCVPNVELSPANCHF